MCAMGMLQHYLDVVALWCECKCTTIGAHVARVHCAMIQDVQLWHRHKLTIASSVCKLNVSVGTLRHRCNMCALHHGQRTCVLMCECTIIGHT